MRTKEGKIIDENITWKDITPGGVIYESGSAQHFNTGDWRTMKPVFKAENCKQCLLCVPVCPDASIPVKDGKRAEFDFEHCKGCGICVKACPFDAIDFVKDEK
ncbi:ferredoxin [Clostridium fermenticellae]|uniref:Ferredoxin n=1 Tax=Clostridium fermenticellae TaxID=2068654 RepID=A0A386H6C7_9CLOT|nr:4Fe-4S dicluster domain-containing protein [Clostridium fermenticellae]AYD41164.1 ferredoxin [Clostridium fermenticellae]